MVDFNRQVRIFDPLDFEDRVVTIIGLGNIGSHAALTLARLGVKTFRLWDPDTIEEHNLSSQSYNHHDIGGSKVSAVAAQMFAINPDIGVLHRPYNYRPETKEDIVVIGVDSLTARRKIAKQLKDPSLIIDGRIGGEQLELYMCQTPEEWAKIIPKGKGSEDPCGAKYISYVSVVIGGLIANQVKKFLKGENLDKNIMINVNSLSIAKNFEW